MFAEALTSVKVVDMIHVSYVHGYIVVTYCCLLYSLAAKYLVNESKVVRLTSIRSTLLIVGGALKAIFRTSETSTWDKLSTKEKDEDGVGTPEFSDKLWTLTKLWWRARAPNE